jgi:hypothetical protein
LLAESRRNVDERQPVDEIENNAPRIETDRTDEHPEEGSHD